MEAAEKIATLVRARRKVQDRLSFPRYNIVSEIFSWEIRVERDFLWIFLSRHLLSNALTKKINVEIIIKLRFNRKNIHIKNVKTEIDINFARNAGHACQLSFLSRQSYHSLGSIGRRFSEIDDSLSAESWCHNGDENLYAAIRTQISPVGGIMIPSSTRARFFSAINLFLVRNFRKSPARYVPREIITLLSIKLQASSYQRDSVLLAIARSYRCHCGLPLADCNIANGETCIL